MTQKKEIIALSAAAVSTMMMSMGQMQERNQVLQAKNAQGAHGHAIRMTLDSTHVQGLIRHNMGTLLQNVEFGDDILATGRIRAEGDVNALLRTTLVAQAGQRDSVGVGQGLDFSCYNNCHSACHGSRSWR